MDKIYTKTNIENVNSRIQMCIYECSQQNSFNFLFEIFHSKMLGEEKYKKQNKKYLFVVLNSNQRTDKRSFQYLGMLGKKKNNNF